MLKISQFLHVCADAMAYEQSNIELENKYEYDV